MITYQAGQPPEDPKQLAAWWRQESLALMQAIQQPEPYLRLAVTTVAPVKVMDGDVYEAAAPWNPGAGDGCYIRRAGAWVKLG